jgi:hypothetical protein
MRKREADKQAAFDATADALRKIHDLSDVARAISAAGRLMAESLEQVAADLRNVATIAKGGKP